MAAQPPHSKPIPNHPSGNEDDKHEKIKKKYTALVDTYGKLLTDY